MEVFFISEKQQLFIDQLEKPARERIKRMIGILRIYGSNIKIPFSKSLGGGLFELRVTGVNNIRLLYAFYFESAFIIHVFQKKSEKIPTKEIEYARKQIKLLKSR